MNKEKEKETPKYEIVDIVRQLTKKQIEILLIEFRFIENPNENVKILNGLLML